MSNIPQVFLFESSEVRVTDQNGDAWFVLRDLLEAMGTKTKVTDAVDSINQGLGDGFARDVLIADSLGRDQSTIIVSEPAATYLLSRSNTDKGRALNRFIHVEVLPSIHKTGSYSVAPPQPMTGAEILIYQGQLMLALEQKQAQLENEQRRLTVQADEQSRRLDQIETASDYFTIIGWHRYVKRSGSLPFADAVKLGKKASAYCKENGITMGEVPDPRFGKVNTYPKFVLDILFGEDQPT